jgi:secondary thiamine-phosphate synthase enzyme
MIRQFNLKLATSERGLINITENVNKIVAEANTSLGLCHIFLHHTSASLTLCENADPLVQRDLETFMVRLIPDGDPIYQHIDEGPDDMPSHIRTVLTQSFLMIPIDKHQLVLGKWQGIYLWEHRFLPHQRSMTITILGETN